MPRAIARNIQTVKNLLSNESRGLDLLSWFGGLAGFICELLLAFAGVSVLFNLTLENILNYLNMLLRFFALTHHKRPNLRRFPANSGLLAL